MVVSYGRARRLKAENGGFRPGQTYNISKFPSEKLFLYIAWRN
jgi:hypothetical protein